MGLYPRDWGGRVSLALDAYYDESGSHDGSHLNVLAGFAARPQQWEAFEREWMKILRKHRITHVRAKHLFHRQRQHKGWKDKQITELWADLMYVIQEREMFASKTYLFEEDYKLFYVSDGPARRERLDSRYALCFRSLLHNLPAVYRTFHLDGDINFVLEAGHRNAGDALRVYSELRENRAFRYGDAIGFLSSVKKQSSCALQAADMLAYLCYRVGRANIDDPGGWISELEEELLDCRLRVVEHMITPEDLKTLRKNFLRRNKKRVFTEARLDGLSFDPEDTWPVDLGRRYDG